MKQAGDERDSKHGSSRRPTEAGFPLLPLAPAFVIVVGIVVGAVVAWMGVAELRRASDESAAARAAAVAATLAARLRVTGSEDRADVVQHAGHRSGADVLLIARSGEVVVDASLGPPDAKSRIDCLVRGSGEMQTAIGRTRFAVHPLGPPLEALSVVAFVQAPEMPPEARMLVQAVAIFTLLLVAAGGAVAYFFSKDARADLSFLRRRITDMAEPGSDPAGEPVPVRALDQVGVLTAAFNRLVERFAAAEQSYRQDLAVAQAMDRDRSALLAALSHELRTPLNAILGFADVLLSEVDGPLDPEARDELEVIRTSASHLRTLIDDILDLSALEFGGLKLRLAPVDVHAVAEEVVREAAPIAQAKSLELRLSGERGLRASADAQRLRQVLGNIVGNALKFTRHGSVQVRVEREGDQIAVSTIDTGPGIAPEERAAIFEEYRQAGDARARAAGTGLGLAIARRLVAMHGGAIEVESALGSGSRFTEIGRAHV